MAIAKHTLPDEKLRKSTYTSRTISDTRISDIIHTGTSKAKHYTMADLQKIAPGVNFPLILKQMGAVGIGAKTDNIL